MLMSFHSHVVLIHTYTHTLHLYPPAHPACTVLNRYMDQQPPFICFSMLPFGVQQIETAAVLVIQFH